LEGVGITLVEGNRENIKITTPFDLIVAEALVSSQEKSGKGAHV
jgi:2-C-methyl-D-erythritol 4-phosphate cytidylyltransferase